MTSSSSSVRFSGGDAVILHGLQESTNLNGARGIVHGFRSNPELMCLVALDADDITKLRGPPIPYDGVSVSPANLSLDYPIGSEVVVRDLVTVSHLNGAVCRVVGFQRSRCRFVVEVAPSGNSANNDGDDAHAGNDGADTTNIGDGEHGDGITVRRSVNGSKKKMSIKPTNLTWPPGRRPKPVPVLDQRLIFTGPMRGVTRVLNHSAYTHAASFANAARLRQEEEMHLGMLAGKVWSKIRSFDGRSGNAGNDDDSSSQSSHSLPPFRRGLVRMPKSGLTRRICFNPKCRRVIQSGTGETMKRCKKCKSVCYCNKGCAIADWGVHKTACRFLAKDGVPLADYVTLTSPHREMTVDSQRMVRLCVNAVASLEDPEQHLAQQSSDAATLLYRILTEAGADIANQVLSQLESPPPPGMEATVCIGFNSLGEKPVFDESDIQKLANIYECNVEYRVKDGDAGDNNWPGHVSAVPDFEKLEHCFPGSTDPGAHDFATFLDNITGGGNWQFMGAGVAGPGDFPMPFAPGIIPGPFPTPQNTNVVTLGPFPVPPGGMMAEMNTFPDMGGTNTE